MAKNILISLHSFIIYDLVGQTQAAPLQSHLAMFPQPVPSQIQTNVNEHTKKGNAQAEVNYSHVCGSNEELCEAGGQHWTAGPCA